jgi:hypothetical protein
MSKTNKLFIFAGFFLSVSIVITCAPYIWTFKNSTLSGNPSDWGSFGSYIGGVLGATFASFSFLCLLYTIRLQRNELKENAIAQQKQRFDDTFYALLSQHNTTLINLQSRYEDKHHLIRNLNTILEPDTTFPRSSLKDAQDEILNDIELSQYFRILYQLLKFICKNNITNQEKEFNECSVSNKNSLTEDEKMYASMVRSYVPVQFLPAMAINCIPTYTGLNNLQLYWLLIERYEFLEHIRIDKLPDNLRTWSILNGYSYAFGKNTNIDNKCHHIMDHFEGRYDDELTEGSYLHTYTLNFPF